MHRKEWMKMWCCPVEMLLMMITNVPSQPVRTGYKPNSTFHIFFVRILRFSIILFPTQIFTIIEKWNALAHILHSRVFEICHTQVFVAVQGRKVWKGQYIVCTHYFLILRCYVIWYCFYQVYLIHTGAVYYVKCKWCKRVQHRRLLAWKSVIQNK